MFFESDDLWTFCVRAVLFVVFCCVFLFGQEILNFNFSKTLLGLFFSEMGGKSEQG